MSFSRISSASFVPSPPIKGGRAEELAWHTEEEETGQRV